MTFQLTVLYGQPTDPAAFDDYYASTHAPLASTMPGLESYVAFHPGADGGEAPATYLVAQLGYADAAAFQAAIGSPEGKAAVADVGNFATGGATMLTGEVHTYV